MNKKSKQVNYYRMNELFGYTVIESLNRTSNDNG